MLYGMVKPLPIMLGIVPLPETVVGKRARSSHNIKVQGKYRVAKPTIKRT
jgi:hypothetical protein